ncbi:Ubiquitin fusion degradation protein 4 [Coniosporium tulheliwenetii]|uniref:Ubiquitin fusion degradation protein 4 n=1 Tax=Coniosporium tulheliwenetii TaxID=3383036 RepID=A0ACC2YXZ7_9PEZI|nr:Ubiquitin fusion degradation protein 4 [Cladosporium sp. JES 115]
MSPRITRSTARSLAASSNPDNANPPPATTAPPPKPPPKPPSRKRKATTQDTSPSTAVSTRAATSRGPSKRAKVEAPEDPLSPSVAQARPRRAKADTAMSNTGPPAGPSEDKNAKPATTSASSPKRGSRRKENKETPSRKPPSSSRRTRKSALALDEDVAMTDTPETKKADNKEKDPSQDSTDDSAEEGEQSHPHDELDPETFANRYLGRSGGPGGLSGTLRALSGMMSATAANLRGILENLRSHDPSVQLIALQELSELLLLLNEDHLAGYFSPDQYVKELVKLMQPSDFGEENPEIMLLACRCIANLMEALPAATPAVVYGGAVPILCQKLLEIHYIDVAEQALSTLERISVEFPASIVREGGLTACLTYLDFFATGTQRSAVTTAANCCRNLPEDSFPVVRDAMPILLNVLNGSDQRVVEQGCLCVSRIVESFKWQESKLEELVSTDLLSAVLRLLLPGSTNLIGPTVHTQFLRVLAITARASPRLSVELFKMKVVDTLYQILTGVSPPSGTDDIATKIDSVVIMQALIHRPRDQVFETLNVICELLPSVSRDGLLYLDDLLDVGPSGDDYMTLSAKSKQPNDKRVQLLEECKDEVKRFATILLPTLTDAYSSTVNLSVRQKVLTAQLKMLSNLDVDILEDALRTVPYASFLASILSQRDHAILVTFALQAAELLLKRLEPIYRYQFYREGVIAEISKLASRPCKIPELKEKLRKAGFDVEPVATSSQDTSSEEDVDLEQEVHIAGDEDNSEDDGDDLEEHEDGIRGGDDEFESSSSEEEPYAHPPMPDVEDLITIRARKFMEVHETEGKKIMQEKAASILEDLRSMAEAMKAHISNQDTTDSIEVFRRLAEYFSPDPLESITSYELLTSGILGALFDLFSGPSAEENADARSAFLEAFMSSCTQTDQKTAAPGATAFSVLVHKLQDLLSRAEHFEVITVHQNSYDSNRSSAASMLAKQLRLKLVADEDSGIPANFRNFQVTIHAIATFKALDDYLRPRISLAERPRVPKSRESSIAAYAAALSSRSPLGGGSSATPPSKTANSSDLTNRLSVKKTRSKQAAVPSTAAPGSSGAPERPSGTRRSSRRHQAQTQATPPPPPPVPAEPSDNLQDPLECADEAPLDDEDESQDGVMDAIMGELEDEMDEDVPEPDPVTLEYAATGKVSARKDDGTRIATPVQGAPAPGSLTADRFERFAALARSQGYLGGSGSSSRPMSYAAAIQSTPQDWHLEFSMNGQTIANETTIYRAVHFNQTQPSEVSARNVWSTPHVIKIKRVEGPPPASSSLSPTPEPTSPVTSDLPQSLASHPATSGILRLLSILHELNSNLDDVLSDNVDTIRLKAESASQFVNTKLTAKLNRQLEEPLIVASNCLPTWSEDLARLYPFLFPFETRHLFLQSTSFGYSRSMTRWQNAQSTNDSRRDRHRDERPFLGRLQRQKVRISRNRILESAIKVMELYGSSPSVLEVEYFEEVGTGLGPTLEFYSTVSKEFSKKRIKLWRENESDDKSEFAFGKQGLFPAPMSEEQANSENGKRILQLFKVLGKFIARSMLDSRIVDVSFNPTFFRVGDATTVAPSLGAIKSVDDGLAKSLKMLKQFATAKKKVDENGSLSAAQKVQAVQNIQVHGTHVEDLGLDFTLPGYPAIELIPNGSNMTVTIDNVALYLEKVLDFTLGSGVQRQVDAFRAGFSTVFPYSALKAFTPDELVMLFGRVEEDWSLETLMDSVKADHGYNLDSKSVRNLLQTMSELSPTQRRDFLQFVTGSPKLPIGGFKSLTPMFTVVCKPSEPPLTSDDYLPSVMTCVNYLKMPDYSSIEVLGKKLQVAMSEGQGAFHLS